jgi:hypothetical protein
MVLAAGVALLEGSTWIPLSNFWVAGIVVIVYLVLINLKNFFLRPYIMGRSVHMNESLVFIIIVIATILEGILGALLVVPLVASTVLIANYIQRRVMGLSPFDEDGSRQFVMPENQMKSRDRKWGRRKSDKGVETADASVETAGLPAALPPIEPAAPPETDPSPKPVSSQEKIEK